MDSFAKAGVSGGAVAGGVIIVGGSNPLGVVFVGGVLIGAGVIGILKQIADEV